MSRHPHPPTRVRALEWSHGRLRLLDQRLLPQREHYLELEQVCAVAQAIRTLVVRGAPAIGIAAAYGVVLAARAAWRQNGPAWRRTLQEALQELQNARPTAINLAWAVARMWTVCKQLREGNDPEAELLQAARNIHHEDADACRRMGAAGAARIQEPCAVYTHCNTGSLATGGCGTALGVIRYAHAAGHIHLVYAGETRPWLQGSRLTAWELTQDRIPLRLSADAAAASLMRRGEISWVITGADRVAANGDVCNKIGTYPLALAARQHGIRFMVVAPTSTIDPHTATGEGIPIENRPAHELTHFAGQLIAPSTVPAHNPVFDITPAELVDFLVTERGTLRRPDRKSLAALLPTPA